MDIVFLKPMLYRESMQAIDSPHKHTKFREQNPMANLDSATIPAFATVPGFSGSSKSYVPYYDHRQSQVCLP